MFLLYCAILLQYGFTTHCDNIHYEYNVPYAGMYNSINDSITILTDVEQYDDCNKTVVYIHELLHRAVGNDERIADYLSKRITQDYLEKNCVWRVGYDFDMNEYDIYTVSELINIYKKQ